jgi:hypothetical protein
MTTLTIALCLSIGCCVAWLVALYTPAGPPSLLWGVPLGVAAAGLCALLIAWLAPWLGAAGLVIAGPVAAYLAILGGGAIFRALFPAQ